MGLGGGGGAEIAGASLQAGLPISHREAFERGLEGWFQALKWLVKEFRLSVGYETLDEEAYIRFWIDRYERFRDTRHGCPPIAEQRWPTADEPVMPATREEVLQSRSWPREEMEARVARLFELKRLLCPNTPVLVPLSCLHHYDGVSDPGSGVMKRPCSSAKQWKAALNQHRQVGKIARLTVQPADKRAASAPRAATPISAPVKVQAPDLKDALFPAHASVGQQLGEEDFVSRVLDLAIEFDGDHALAAGREGQQLLACGTAPHPRRLWRGYEEGRSRLEDLKLCEFWQSFGEKANFGLLMSPSVADVYIKRRMRGETFADNVLGVFFKRFRYECLDVAVLYRFWLAMPKAVRSASHVRGFPERQAFELISAYVQVRDEERRAALADGLPAPPACAVAAAAAAAASGGRPAWRHPGDAMWRCAAQLDARSPQVARARALVLPQGPPRRGDMASPRKAIGPLAYLRMLVKQFPGDTALTRMIEKQCLDAGWESRRGGRGVHKSELYMLVNDMDIGSQIATSKPTSSREVLHEALNKRSLPPPTLALQFGRQHTQKLIEAYGKAQEVKKNIDRFLRRCAHEAMRTFKGTKKNLKGGNFHVEDVFAKLCQQAGCWEVLDRFGIDYLPKAQGCVPGGFMSPGFPLTPGALLSIAKRRGGATTDCSTRRARCLEASSTADGCSKDDAVDGLPETGWCPNPVHAERGGAWWIADLGQPQSCVGVVLNWVAEEADMKQFESPITAKIEVRVTSEKPIENGRETQPDTRERVLSRLGKRSATVESDREEVIYSDSIDVAPTAFVFSLKQDGNNYADCDGAYELSRSHGTLNRKPIYVNHVKSRFVAFDGRKWVIKRMEHLRVVKETKKIGDGFHSNDGANISDTWREYVVHAQVSSDVPVVFFGRYVSIEFPEKWPQLPNGRSFKLSVRVIKVWRLAPPHFRYYFSGMLQDVERKHARSKDPGVGFWIAAHNPTTPNRKIHHVWQAKKYKEERKEHEAYKEAQRGTPANKEFHTERGEVIQRLRERIHARLQDAQECTFHPRVSEAAGVVRKGENTSSRTVKDFYEDAINHDSYKIVRKRHHFNKAKNLFLKGDLAQAADELRKRFRVEQILQRFKCGHKDCKSLLDIHSQKCGRCAGYYCSAHHPGPIHKCDEMRVVLDKAKKKRDKEYKEMTGLPDDGPPQEENFGDKKSIDGLLQEVFFLAEAIEMEKRHKEKQRERLEHVEQSLALFGPVRLAERPYRPRLCSKAHPGKRSWTQEGGAKIALPRDKGPPAETPPACDCPAAHHVSELRFPAADRAGRMASAMKAALARAERRSGSVFASEKMRKETKDDDNKLAEAKGKASEAKQRGARRRIRSEPRGVAAFKKKLDSGARDLSKASTHLVKARAHMQEGHFKDVERHTSEIWNLAAPHLRDAEYFADVVNTAASGDPVHPPAPVPDLRSQIRALAGEKVEASGGLPNEIVAPAPPAVLTRPFRDCERDDILRRSTEISQEAQSVLAQCSEVEWQLRQRVGQEQANDDAALQGFIKSVGQEQDHDDAALMGLLGMPLERAPTPSAPAAFGDILGRQSYDSAMNREHGRARPRSQMCPDLLEKGFCRRGPDCPHAHRPSELSSRTELGFDGSLHLGI